MQPGAEILGGQVLRAARRGLGGSVEKRAPAEAGLGEEVGQRAERGEQVVKEIEAAAMTRAWAAEFSPSGVRVNAFAPGPFSPTAAPAR